MRGVRGPMLFVAAAVAIWALFLRGNPGGISDARYAQFKGASPPKVLYSCTRTPTRKAFITEERDCLKTGRSNCEAKIDDMVKAGTKVNVDFVAGDGMSTYDQLLMEARRSCSKAFGSTEAVEFRILEAEKT
jgi:hypothetical protein